MDPVDPTMRIFVEGELVSLDDFLAIPLPDRVRMLLERRVAFFSGTRPVEASVALAGLRRAQARTR